MLTATIITASLFVIACGLALLAIATRIPLLGVLALAYFAATFIRRRSLIPRGLFAAFGALLTVPIVYVWWNGDPRAPDAFYDVPRELPPAAGALLKSEPFTRAVPAGAQAWRILYTTTTSSGRATTASAIVAAALQLPAGPRPVVLWTHGTAGIAPACAPSVLPDPFPFAWIPALDRLIAEGWIFVAPDYAGLGTVGPHEYLIGEGEARSALDSVRAARKMRDVTLENRTVVWGHSQGGHAALWTGIVAPRYAPEVAVLGVAALAPATELAPLVDAAKGTIVGKILSLYVVSAYSAVYPDVRFDDYAYARARTRRIADRCLASSGLLLSVATSATLERPFFKQSPMSGALAERLKQNTPRELITSPVMIAQGRKDDLVLPDVQDRYVKEQCAAGQHLQYRTYDALDHLTLVSSESPLSPEIIEWSRARFEGEPAAPHCVTTAR